MTAEKYKQELKELGNVYEINKRTLAKEYAIANNPYKIGDTFTDHIGSIKIERISFYLPAHGLPCCVYHGLILNKDGSVSKLKKNKRDAYQRNQADASKNIKE